MLFTSYEFVLVFLPVVMLVVLGSTRLGLRTPAKAALFLASLTFYAWWNVRYVALLLAILAFNFTLGSWLIRTAGRGESLARRRLAVFVLGVIVNIAVLVYFKYTNFLVEQLRALTGAELWIEEIVLPLGLSFITFQKIAFLTDAYNGEIQRLGWLDYSLFVSFFPQLIAGPIVHHREVIPQFESDRSLRYSSLLVAIGIAFFVFGAFKKVLIADQLASQVALDFNTAANGAQHGVIDAWIGSVTFTLQVYFDFSGYSDMAIGLALLFGVRLPVNFNSPLKASSMIDFWGRWHMTLTRFLTAYIYTPIVLRATRRRVASGKKVATRGVMSASAFAKLLVVPTMITMFIAGLWHGAGVQFIVFGLIHGAYLVINHGWRNFRHSFRTKAPDQSYVGIARLITFVALVISMPFFRADSATTAGSMVLGMFGAHGLGIHTELMPSVGTFGLIAAAFAASQVLPNSQEVLALHLDAATVPLTRHAGDPRALAPSWSWPHLTWRPSVWWALGIGLAAWFVLLNLAAPSDFLYFQF